MGTRRRVRAPVRAAGVFGDLRPAEFRCHQMRCCIMDTGEDLQLLIGCPDDPEDDGMGRRPGPSSWPASWMTSRPVATWMWAAVVNRMLRLRPAEQGAIHIIDNELKVSDIKRNRQQSKSHQVEAQAGDAAGDAGRTDGDAVALYVKRVECCRSRSKIRLPATRPAKSPSRRLAMHRRRSCASVLEATAAGSLR